MIEGIYQIKVKGQLDARRSEWFEGWDITSEEDGTTVLTGQVVDQSNLNGVLIEIYNLNLSIISVKYEKPDQDKNKKI